MALRQYEMIVRHEDPPGLFAFKAKFDDQSKEHARFLAKFIKIADKYYVELKEIGFKLQSCNFDLPNDKKI